LHLAANFRNHSCIGERFYWRGARVDSENIAASRGSGFHGNRRGFILNVLVVSTRLASSQEKRC
jgi:hypothetical protein